MSEVPLPLGAALDEIYQLRAQWEAERESGSPERGDVSESNEVPLHLYGAALDEIYQLRVAMVYLARLIEEHLDYKTFPKSRRRFAKARKRQPEGGDVSEQREAATMRRIGWMHPGWGNDRVLTDKAKAFIESRASQDPTYTDGWVPVYTPDSSSSDPEAGRGGDVSEAANRNTAHVVIEVDVHKEHTNEIEDWQPPSPREVAAFVQERLAHTETDDGWFVGIVRATGSGRSDPGPTKEET